NGDIDLGEGQALRNEYAHRKRQATPPAPANRETLEQRITEVVTSLDADVVFLAEGLKNADREYEKKFNSPTTSKEALKSLCWERIEFNTLLLQSQKLKCTMEGILAHLNPDNPRVGYVITSLRNLRPDYLKYLRNLFTKKRQPAATHVLVILISEERRCIKPYALPVWYVPYKSIKNQFLRDLLNKVKSAMVELGMIPVGAVTDGEFSSLRTQGETRPLHMIQLIHYARESVSRLTQHTLLSMLLSTGVDAAGRPKVSQPNRHIPDSLITELHSLRTDHNMSLEDAVTYLRGKLVPNGYSPYTFHPNTPESFLDKLRSLVGTYIYRGEHLLMYITLCIMHTIFVISPQ
ncbi:uncharacterized protein LOC116617329, partial [Nematostella vectensis]|uniref:uncharacterized protein LOC116617329 n=1 Tax=Nematostella vectensis TaxID=45351 RepID=UPI002077685C